MNKKDFELLIEKYKKDECFDKVDELLEKQIIIFYSNKITFSMGKFDITTI